LVVDQLEYALIAAQLVLKNLDGDDLRMLIQVFQHLGPVIVGLLFHRADLRCIQVVRLLPEEALAEVSQIVGKSPGLKVPAKQKLTIVLQQPLHHVLPHCALKQIILFKLEVLIEKLVGAVRAIHAEIFSDKTALIHQRLAYVT